MQGHRKQEDKDLKHIGVDVCVQYRSEVLSHVVDMDSSTVVVPVIPHLS